MSLFLFIYSFLFIFSFHSPSQSNSLSFCLPSVSLTAVTLPFIILPETPPVPHFPLVTDFPLMIGAVLCLAIIPARQRKVKHSSAPPPARQYTPDVFFSFCLLALSTMYLFVLYILSPSVLLSTLPAYSARLPGLSLVLGPHLHAVLLRSFRRINHKHRRGVYMLSVSYLPSHLL